MIELDYQAFLDCFTRICLTITPISIIIRLVLKLINTFILGVTGEQIKF